MSPLIPPVAMRRGHERPLPAPGGAAGAGAGQAVSGIPHVVQAQRLFGDPDCFLRVVTRDLPAYQRLYDERPATLPGVQRLTPTLVMKSVVDNRALPL